MEFSYDNIRQAADLIRARLHAFSPTVGIILGSGLGVLAAEVESAVRIPYDEIPGFPVSRIHGHEGQLVAGRLAGERVLLMQGRSHFYEGYPIRQLGFPVWVMKLLGVHTLILTNAAGATNPAFQPGDLMLITDHINMVFTNPLIGENLPELGTRFPDTSRIYDPALCDIARDAAAGEEIILREGVYQFNTGPAYETPAEVKMARSIGADAIGMSTVPEALAAVHCGLRVMGFSYISNLAAGIGEEVLSHAEVISNMEQVKDRFIRLISAILKRL